MAEAMAAGVPQLIRPLSFDQIDNGVRIRRLGIGNWIKPGSAHDANMARALSQLGSAEVAARCREVASQCREVNGLDAAADLIEAIASKKP
jgi:rhamnosyltransferase subunit B